MQQDDEKYFQIKWLGSIETDDLLKQFCPELSKAERQEHLEVIGPIIEQIQIEYQKHIWNLLKTHHEIQSFIQLYNAQFNSKLTLGSFMFQGVKQISNNRTSYKWHIFQKFFEVNDLSLNKIKSMRMLKNCGGRYRQKYCCNIKWLLWKERKFVITSEGVLYFEKSDRIVREYIPFDIEFEARKGVEISKGNPLNILLISNHRHLLISANTIYDYILFLYFLKKGCKQAAQLKKNRFESFAPERLKNDIQFKVDGQEYYSAVADAIAAAKEEILIAGWWVSPQFYLKRTNGRVQQQYRLDRLLESSARKNVKIYILVYFQSSFLTNDSEYTKSYLESLSENIKIIRHPLGVLPTLWSHHQKIVVIDQAVAFIGGFDLCYARYDNRCHRIDQNTQQMYPGIEYNNIRINDLINVRDYNQSSIQRYQARLPWHDVGLQIHGESVKDITKHFVDYWNFANFQTHHHNRLILTVKAKKQKRNIIQRKLEQGVQKIKNLANDIKQLITKKKDTINSQFSQREKKTEYLDQVMELGLNSEEKRSTLRNTSNINHQYEKAITESEKHYVSQKNYVTEKTTCEIAQIKNSQVIIRSREYFQENQIPSEKNFLRMVKRLSKIEEIQEIQQQKNQENQIQSLYDKEQAQRQQGNLNSILEHQGSIKKRFSEQFLNSTYVPNTQYQFDQCQIVRSVSYWSIGCKPTHKERSIHLAYLWLISQAKHFIYIENQFFISATELGKNVKNQIAQALIQRIKEAIEKGQQFKVLVMMPLIPGFAGELNDPNAVVPRLVMRSQYKTIIRSSNSILQRIRKYTLYPQNYIQFYGLRQHGVIQNTPMTQIIYLHSKLMIVDDENAICGSANINDRSMHGSRDSQICGVISGGSQVKKIINNSPKMVSKKIHQLRIKLWKQHFGLEEQILQDPLNSNTIKEIRQRTSTNTKIYRQLFGCYPDDMITRLSKLDSLKRMPTLQQYLQLAPKILGNAVQFPLYFLKEEKLNQGSSIYPSNIST